MRLGKINVNNPGFPDEKRIISIIGVYFLICWFIMILLTTIWYIPNSAYHVTSLELAFLAMVMIPYVPIQFWIPRTIWDVKDNWHMRDEMVYLYIILQIVYFWCLLAVCFLIFLDISTVLQIRVCLESFAFVTTIVCVTV